MILVQRLIHYSVNSLDSNEVGVIGIEAFNGEAIS